MHPKGRYNIGVARKNNVMVKQGTVDDIDAFYEILKATGDRDGFQISQKSHYARFLTDLQGSFILMAMHDKKPIAGLLGVVWGKTGIYYYGASSYEHRQLMAPYLLQWEAIQYCKGLECAEYDLLGISPPDATEPDSWNGISDFKRKFGGTVILYPAEQMLVLRPLVKAGIEWKRRILG